VVPPAGGGADEVIVDGSEVDDPNVFVAVNVAVHVPAVNV
jgi:hypothetical protein